MQRRTNPLDDRRRKAEQTLPVRLTIRTPPLGLGQALNGMHRWLEVEVGKGGYDWLPGAVRGMDASYLYLRDLGTAQAFVERWPMVGLR